jgi:phage-related protein
MSYDIGPKIGIEGEAEFRSTISGINTNLKTLQTEMMAVTSKFDKNEESTESLTDKNIVLNKQIDEQKSKLSELTKGLSLSADKYGENDKVTQGWQQAVNKANADLNNMERELRGNESALNDTAKGLDDAGKAADESGNRFSEFGTILKSSAIAAGAVAIAAGAAAIKLGSAVVKQFGELEQNLGGSEAVFGDYAKSIQKTGEDAYKNLGVSQSDYLATANKMGALFQGSGIEQQESVELTEKAMQRAADMASVMGIDMESALEAVTGAAKGNFTMMDNLGVAMNETSVQAYASAKGLDFVWASATQAEKSEVAMQMFFENTEQYAGNFARESTETVTGSIGLLQAALGSFTAGLGNTDADMKNLTENLVDAFQSVVKNIAPIIKNIAGALPMAFSAILPVIRELLPDLLNVVIDLFKQVLDTLITLFPELIPVVVEALLMIVNTIIDNLPLIIEGAFTLIMALSNGIIEALPQLTDATISIIMTLIDNLINLLPILIPAALAIIVALANGLIENLPSLIERIPTIVETIVNVVVENLPLIIDAALQIIMALAGALIQNLPLILESVISIIGSILKGLISGIVNIITFVPKLFSSLVSEFSKIDWAELGINIILGIANGIASAAANLASSVVDAAKGALDSAKDFLGIESPSTVMRDQVGKMMGAGMAEGITNSAKEVDYAMNGLNENLIADSTISTNSTGNSGSGSYNAIVNVPVELDGNIISKSSGRIQYGKNMTRSRSLGVTTA